MPKLTNKQEMFCKEYLIDLNATQAAIRAGYSKKTAKQMGTENLAKPVLAKYIQDSMDKRSEKVETDAEWVLKGIKDLTDDLIQSDSPQHAYKGYELMGKHHKLFTDKFEIDGRLIVSTIRKRFDGSE